MVRRLAFLVACLALACLPVVAHADATDDAVRRIGMQLQCPVCEGQNVADSNSGLAQDMRAVIRSRVLAGESDQTILDGFVASYGEGILTEPPKRGISLGVWLGAAAAFLVGALVVFKLITGWRRPAASTGERPVSVDPDVVDEFERFRGGTSLTRSPR
jgi:cytochrome c-type biogenesis protein CcmH